VPWRKNMKRALFAALAFAVLNAVSALAEKPKLQPWQIYELKQVYLADEPGFPVLYVLGVKAFKTVEALKKDVGQIPAGNKLKWIPASDLPLRGDPLGDQETQRGFIQFVKGKGIQLEIVRRP